MKNQEFNWHRSWHGHRNGKAQSKRVARDPYVEAHVYMNAHDGKTWCGNIENHGSPGAWGTWPHVGRIKFHFKTRADAKRWVEQEIPKVRRELTKARKDQRKEEACGTRS